MKVKSDQLGNFLFDAGLISRAEFARAAAGAEEEGILLADLLVQRGIVSDDDIRKATALALGIPFILLENQILLKEHFVHLPEPMARTHNAMVIGAEGGRLKVALLHTDDLEPIQNFLGTSWTVVPHLTSRASIKYALMQYQKMLKDSFGAKIAEELRALEHSHQMNDQRGAVEASVRATDALLQHALHMKAREMHMEPSAQGLRIRYRLGSALYDSMNIPAYTTPLLSARLKSLAHMPLTDVLGTGRFKMSPEGVNTVVVTVSSLPIISQQGSAEKLVLSFMHEGAGKSGFSLRALGALPHTIEDIGKLIHQTSGLVLVCGTAGSGKTSMLYTMLDECIDSSKHLASVEDSVSHILPGVAQMEVDESLGLSALSCVRAQLKHHPDVLMIDSPLTEEVALLAAQAANRGVLVLLGVEAVTAGEGIAQMLALGVPQDLLAAVCIGSIGVHMAPRLCAHKRVSYRPTRDEQTLLEDTIDIKETLAALKKEQVIDARAAWKDVELYRAAPCSECEDGFAGVVGLQEVVQVSRMLKELVRTGADAYELEIQAKRDGALTLAEDALYRAIQGIVSVDTLLEVAAGYRARYS